MLARPESPRPTHGVATVREIHERSISIPSQAEDTRTG
jgi:hypothetical protein